MSQSSCSWSCLPCLVVAPVLVVVAVEVEHEEGGQVVLLVLVLVTVPEGLDLGIFFSMCAHSDSFRNSFLGYWHLVPCTFPPTIPMLTRVENFPSPDFLFNSKNTSKYKIEPVKIKRNIMLMYMILSVIAENYFLIQQEAL